MKKFLVSLTLLAAVLCSVAQTEDCGKWRWGVKTLTDAEGMAVLETTPEETTVRALATAPEPFAPRRLTISMNAQNGLLPRLPDEKQLVRVKGKITGVKLVGGDGDMDYHIVLSSDDGEHNIVCEIPSPDCPTFANNEPLRELYGELREEFNEAVFKPTTRFKDLPTPIEVEMEGVPLWDAPHGSRGAAPNGREIHPVTAIYYPHEEPATPVMMAKFNGAAPGGTAATPLNVFLIIMIAMLLGAAGQCARIVVGLKKYYDTADSSTATEVSGKRIAISLLIAVVVGAVCGIVAGMESYGVDALTKSTLLAFFTAGYVGSDFIEGFMKKNSVK